MNTYIPIKIKAQSDSTIVKFDMASIAKIQFCSWTKMDTDTNY
jgi:hypothetical protein